MYDPLIKVLEGTRARLTPEGAWTKGVYALDRHGSQTGTDSRDAVCWCVSGALHRVHTEYVGMNGYSEDYVSSSTLTKFVNDRAGEYGVADVIGLNDYLCESQQDILNFLDWCIAYRKWELAGGKSMG